MRNCIIAIVVALVVGLAVGRWLAPEKVRTETKTVEVEKKVNDTKKTTKKRVTVVVITHPDGTKEERTITEDITQDENKQTDENKKKSDVVREETKKTSNLTISALAGAKFGDSSGIVYGASVSRSLFGPVQYGLWGLTNGTVGVSLGLTF